VAYTSAHETPLQRICAVLILLCLLASLASATAYDGRPKLIVIILIDQFRGDCAIATASSKMASGSSLIVVKRSSTATDCANTKTAPTDRQLWSTDLASAERQPDPSSASEAAPGSRWLCPKTLCSVRFRTHCLRKTI
jgi:hypothetical protein